MSKAICRFDNERCADPTALRSKFFTQERYPKGTRSRDDLSYQRPLQLDTPAPQHW